MTTQKQSQTAEIKIFNKSHYEKFLFNGLKLRYQCI